MASGAAVKLIPEAVFTKDWNPSPRRRELFWRWVDVGDPDECWPWLLPLDAKGYGHATVDGWRTTAHRIAYALENGRFPDELNILHACDFRACCNPGHLEPGTQAKNLEDMRAKGRGVIPEPRRREAHGMAKLTESAVEEIRRRRAAGETQQSIADAMGVSQSQVGRIIRGENWPVDQTQIANG